MHPAKIKSMNYFDNTTVTIVKQAIQKFRTVDQQSTGAMMWGPQEIPQQIRKRKIQNMQGKPM